MRHLECKSSKWHSKLLIKRQRSQCDVSRRVRFALVFLTNKLCWDLYKWQSPEPWAPDTLDKFMQGGCRYCRFLSVETMGPRVHYARAERDDRVNSWQSHRLHTPDTLCLLPRLFNQIYFDLQTDGRTDDAWERMHRCQSCVVHTCKMVAESKRPTNKSARLSRCASLSHLHKTTPVQMEIIVVINGQKWQWNEKISHKLQL